jgi:hypothetical protein
MASSRYFVAALAVATAGLLFWLRHTASPEAKPEPATKPALVSAAAASPSPADAPASATAPADSSSRKSNSTAPGARAVSIATTEASETLERITTADALGAPAAGIQDDLRILVTLFEDWRSFYPGAGNPWGDNAEITAALTGKNRRQLVFIDPAHRAINRDGELCDRWNTPFRFHALSGERMEIRSAGPDKKFGTDDDAQVSPP